MNNNLKGFSIIGLTLFAMTLVIASHLTKMTYAIAQLSGSFRVGVWNYVPTLSYIGLAIMLIINLWALFSKKN